MAKLFVCMTENEVTVNSKVGATCNNCKQITSSMFTCREVDSSLASKAVDPVLNGHDLCFSAMAASSLAHCHCRACENNL